MAIVSCVSRALLITGAKVDLDTFVYDAGPARATTAQYARPASSCRQRQPRNSRCARARPTVHGIGVAEISSMANTHADAPADLMATLPHCRHRTRATNGGLRSKARPSLRADTAKR